MLGAAPDRMLVKPEPSSVGGDPPNAENLIEGMWLVENTNMPERGLIFNCSGCSVSFEDRISYEIHLQGLRHKKANRVASADAGKKLRHLSQLETILQEEQGPLLGLNYVTEYFHAGGRYECLCNLCCVVFDNIQSMRSHVSSTSHMINFMFACDKQMYDAVKFKTHDESFVFLEASKLETSRNERSCRSKIMEELGNIWVEFQHEGRTSCTDLVGHQLSREYDGRATLMTTEMNTFENLSDGFNKLFALANGFPPSCSIDNFNKLHFLEVLGKMDIRNEKDADICLQLANFLTVSLLKYRTKQVKNMKSVDASSVKAKLNFLTVEAERVAGKLTSRNQWSETSLNH